LGKGQQNGQRGGVYKRKKPFKIGQIPQSAKRKKREAKKNVQKPKPHISKENNIPRSGKKNSIQAILH